MKRHVRVTIRPSQLRTLRLCVIMVCKAGNPNPLTCSQISTGGTEYRYSAGTIVPSAQKLIPESCHKKENLHV